MKVNGILKDISDVIMRRFNNVNVSMMSEAKLSKVIDNLYSYAEMLLPEKLQGKFKPVFGRAEDGNRIMFGWVKVPPEEIEIDFEINNSDILGYVNKLENKNNGMI